MSVATRGSSIEDLTVSFDGFKALNKLTLHVDPGEMLCIIGPNGAGKTTMMDVITGKTRPDSGTARFGPNRICSVVRGGNRAGRNRAEVSETDRVRAVDGVREPRTGVGRQPVVPENAACPHYAAQHKRIDEVLEIIGLEEQRERREEYSRTARSSGSKSACC
jgi:urea transport system ATP-binding protein